ncbi:MAG TPA: asparagine synthase-related protein, partial [Gemmataceae bacterium]|nr:asparagine synthase-related protein [Gemmataceae bacterium]
VLAGLASRYGLSQRCDVLTLQRADLQEYLPNDILTKTDRTSMAHGLETRAPFLEHELAAWAASLPAAYKLGPGGQLKSVLRQCVRQVYGPQIADRPKQGFSLPIHAWMRGPFAPVLKELLAPASVARLGALDPVAVRNVLADHLSGRRSLGFELWGLAVLVAWYQARIERQPDAPAITDLREWHFEFRPQAA